MRWLPVRKIAATIVAAVVTAGPIAILDAVGVHVDTALGVLIVGILTPLAGYLTPEAAAPALPAGTPPTNPPTP
ncbi:hypothetical protein ATK30_6867 [Amycolatopsis echigonensis]|uniref:Holin n=1 Tax=Amycolatopsis echigonensis TaxID=2576905 RepID=A0A2N3WPZ3_9PSEU|nr:hypothetical protein [Amycolatopsis niigatensis]PKV95934.1 hypothetical protein ATK30_6867 [Amycolatopsis niigatensis]